jgi:hypothetical protein
MIRKYKKKPPIVEAIRWERNNLREVVEFTGMDPTASKRTWKEYEKIVENDGLEIHTPEGRVLVNIGDMIVRDAYGRYHSCDPGVFAEVYELC